MPETITMPKFYSNHEIAEMFGCTPEYIRKLKSTKKDELAGLWKNDGGDNETYWNEEGLNKLSELISTDKAKEFRAGQLARRTQEASAVDRAELYQNEVDENSTRTGKETASYKTGEGRYANLHTQFGVAIADRVGDEAFFEKVDEVVVSELLKKMNLGTINVETFFGKS
ncbi:MAG: hypothetical protein WCO45_16965 [Pseudanabaena sp. ELA607]|jgi:hypothetical protein